MAIDVSTYRTRRSVASDRTHDFVLATIQAHAGSLLRIARRFSICADDAQDAYQRALEIFVKRADSLDPEGAGPWLRTVVKHEALAVRAARAGLLGPGDADLDQHEATRLQTPDERIASFDRLTRSAEALQRLKPHELRALVLKAQGLFVGFRLRPKCLQIDHFPRAPCTQSSVLTQKSAPLPPKQPTNAGTIWPICRQFADIFYPKLSCPCTV